jgi:tRNA threonylcarbamoyladenosine biosynthesis protein TsaB
MRYKNILAFDTAMSGCGACFFDAASNHEYFESSPMARGQAEQLVPMISRVLQVAGRKYSEIDAIVTTVGPGAFTGLRIGLSAAKSLALALDVPAFGITTLQILALQHARRREMHGDMMVLVETKREDFYAQIFDAHGTPVSEARAIEAADVEALARGKKMNFVGDAVARFQSTLRAFENGWIFDARPILPDTALMARILAEEGGDSPLLYRQLEPVYMRGPDVSTPKKPQRVIAAESRL